MADVKTKPTAQSAKAALSKIEPAQKRDDSLTLLAMFEKITGEKAVMWGTSIVGFGKYTVLSGKKENVWPLAAFSPRKQNLTLYVLGGGHEGRKLLPKLGKHKASGGCLHINTLSDVDLAVLAKIITLSFRHSKKNYG